MGDPLATPILTGMDRATYGMSSSPNLSQRADRPALDRDFTPERGVDGIFAELKAAFEFAEYKLGVGPGAKAFLESLRPMSKSSPYTTRIGPGSGCV